MEYHNFVFNQLTIEQTLPMDPIVCATAQYTGQPQTATLCMDLHDAGRGESNTDLCHPTAVPVTPVQNEFTVADWLDKVDKVCAEAEAAFLDAGMSNTLLVLSGEDVESVLPPPYSEESLFDLDDFLGSTLSQPSWNHVARNNDYGTHYQHPQDVTHTADTLQQSTSAQVLAAKQEFSPDTDSPAPAQNTVMYTVSADVGPITIKYSLPEKTSAYKSSRAVCHICDKRFENKYKLSLHMNSHTGNRPFVCDICGKRFMRSTTLNAHGKVHKKAELKCTHCDRSFKRQQDLLLHLLTEVCLRQREFRRTPTGFMCDLCGEFLASRTLVQEHCQQMHKSPQQVCPVCGEDFTHRKRFKLLTHAREAHPDYVKSLQFRR